MIDRYRCEVSFVLFYFLCTFDGLGGIVLAFRIGSAAKVEKGVSGCDIELDGIVPVIV